LSWVSRFHVRCCCLLGGGGFFLGAAVLHRDTFPLLVLVPCVGFCASAGGSCLGFCLAVAQNCGHFFLALPTSPVRPFVFIQGSAPVALCSPPPLAEIDTIPGPLWRPVSVSILTICENKCLCELLCVLCVVPI